MAVFGTRPEAIKMAPVVRLLEDSPVHEVVVTVTGQHREMLDQVLDLFRMTADYDLDIGAPGADLADLTSRCLSRLAPVIREADPDVVLVQGDTTSTLVGALGAFYAQVPVAHLEAGLRTGNPMDPFPEEMNRRLTTRIATLHLAATQSARENLLRDGVPADQVLVTGNTVIDALIWAVQQDRPIVDPLLAAAERHNGRVVLVTTHRRESWGEPMRRIAEAVARLARSRPSVLFVVPMHLNPLVREVLRPTLEPLSNVLLGEPADYWSFSRLMRRADLLMTDSGGVQEEGPSLGKPVLVMRETTERPEAVVAGAARLVGTRTHSIVAAVDALLSDDHAYASMANAVNPYGDGRAACRTVRALDRLLGAGDTVEEFFWSGQRVA